MKKLLLTLITTGVTLTAAAASSDAVRAVAPYVYPQNLAIRNTGVTFMADGSSFAIMDADCRSVVRVDIKSGEVVEKLIDLGNTRETSLPNIEGFILSPDNSKMLVWTASEPIYRRSTRAQYFTYDIRTRLLRPLSDNHPLQESPLFSPDGRMVAFVAGNNIYLRKLDYQSEVAVTDDGAPGKIINGVADWTYEEEFTTVCSMAWAPDCLTLSYIKYDETAVPSYYMQRYYSACDGDEADELYPAVWSYKYPVAGKPNSRVSIHSYDVDNRKTKDIALPDARIEYIPRIEYGPDAETLVVATLNRDQNHFEVYRVNPKSTVAKSIYTEDSRTWINPAAYEDMRVDSDGLVINSWKSGWNALYFISYTGSEVRTISMPDADVTAYYGSDAKGNSYFQAAAPTPLDRTIYKLAPKGGVTPVSATSGTTDAVASPGCEYFATTYSDTEQVPVIALVTSAGKEVYKLADNSALKDRSAGKHAPREFFTMNSDGVTLNGYIIKPAGFDASRKYPVVMYQYSGPGSQEVLHRWQFDWMDAFAQEGYVVVCVDGRGTGGRGRAFTDIVYRNLGHYETIDQLAAARYAASLPYVDASRIGIFGWSYGGYETLMAATADSASYAAAVAVAPVTDWRFYDTVYAERYMLTPQQNETGYRDSAPLWHTSSLACPLLIMYGTADDNVHPANTLEFVSRLQRMGGLCDMFVFPNMNHSINGCNARSVVYGKMLDWFNKNL
ncbi:MAG: S9 family peptidase [Muribaculaceae bacterium]|nr:S9 family peptidase [Muribaculaceae bacterium]